MADIGKEVANTLYTAKKQFNTVLLCISVYRELRAGSDVITLLGINALIKSLLRNQCWDIFAEHMLWYLVRRINAVIFVAKSMLRYSGTVTKRSIIQRLRQKT
jgi:hypothetical protein